MEIHGYANQGLAIEDIRAMELAEITLVATPEELRRIAQFLTNCANGIEQDGKLWEHEHLADQDDLFEDSPHFVVFNPDCS